MSKVKLVGQITGRVYEVDFHRVETDPATNLKFIKTANEFAFEVVEEVKEVKATKPTAKKTTPKAKPQEVKTEKEAE